MTILAVYWGEEQVITRGRPTQPPTRRQSCACEIFKGHPTLIADFRPPQNDGARYGTFGHHRRERRDLGHRDRRGQTMAVVATMSYPYYRGGSSAREHRAKTTCTTWAIDPIENLDYSKLRIACSE